MAIPASVLEIRTDGRIPAYTDTAAKMLGKPIRDMMTKRMLKGTILDLWVGGQLYVVATTAAENN